MNSNLLIVGAGIYGTVAAEIAKSMNCFEKIAFIDDNKKGSCSGIDVAGTCDDIENLAAEYSNVIVAIGNPEVRLSLLRKFEKFGYNTVTLISPRAYISPSAQIMKGCIIEPMAVVHAMCVLEDGCIVSAGAVVNHASKCCVCVHIDCNATVSGGSVVPAATKVCSGEVYQNNKI